MNNLDNYYYEIKETFQEIDKVRRFIPRANWQWVPYQTIAMNFDQSLDSDPFIKNIGTTFNGRLRLYKFPANYVYHWHRDNDIGCSLNMVLDVYNSHTLFTHSNPKQVYLEAIIELNYKPNTWYIFNSQEKHSVINLDDRARVLFTLIMPKEVKYHDVVEWYKQYSKNL
jgi:hypothetical protein